MSLTELEATRAKKVVGEFVERRRPPLHMRDEVDLGYRIARQSVEIFEVRPVWQRPEEKLEHGVAKATFVRSHAIWKVYWLRADLKWHSYEPAAEVGTLSEFVSVVEEDAHGCFWG
jgi:hypothetical protein